MQCGSPHGRSPKDGTERQEVPRGEGEGQQQEVQRVLNALCFPHVSLVCLLHNYLLVHEGRDKRDGLPKTGRFSHGNRLSNSLKKMSSIHTVIVHPIVLLGITDHVKRMSKMSKGRVVGVLLGSCQSGVVDCTTSFASSLRYRV